MKINVGEYALMDGVHIHKYLNEDNFKVPLNYDRPVMDQCRYMRTVCCRQIFMQASNLLLYIADMLLFRRK